MSNHSSGHAAEAEAVDFLKQHGFKIRERNWRTKLCEIDIIAEKAGAIYFVEVKSRQSGSQGTGLEYITPKKLSQMRFAAELWVSQAEWDGEYQLAAIGIDGGQFTFIDDL